MFTVESHDIVCLPSVKRDDISSKLRHLNTISYIHKIPALIFFGTVKHLPEICLKIYIYIL